jgi:predicted nucleic acid-binding protein
MRVLLDINVLLDVVQRREPFYAASAAVLSRVARGKLEASIAAHAVTTLHYLVTRLASRREADDLIDWLVGAMEVASVGKAEVLRARALRMHDFEDAVTAGAAESLGCQVILTRNLGDFRESPVVAMTPIDFLANETSGL